MPSINRKQHFHLSGKQAGLAVTSVHPFWIFPIDEDFQCSAAQRQLHTGDKMKGEKNTKKCSKQPVSLGENIPRGLHCFKILPPFVLSLF